MKKLLILSLIILTSCATPKDCCAQVNLKKYFKFATFYGAASGGTSISDIETFSVNNEGGLLFDSVY